jgi:hypothetical protein
MAIEKTERLAVLIDADNTQATIIEGLLAEVAKYGTSKEYTATGLRRR